MPSADDRVSEKQEETRLLHVTDSLADPVFEALTSDTARAILAETYDGPRSIADLVKTIDASENEIQRELDALVAANLLIAEMEEADNETSHAIYLPSTTGIVLFAGDGVREISPRRGVAYLLGTVGVLAITSLLVNQLMLSVFGPHPPIAVITSAIRDSSKEVVPNPTPTITSVAGAEPILYRPPPGLIFFAGGLAVLTIIGMIGYWLLSRQRVPIYLPLPMPEYDD